MASSNASQPPYSRARAAGGLFLFLIVGILAVIDAMTESYTFELGPMALMLGTGTVLLGVEGIKRITDRVINGQ